MVPTDLHVPMMWQIFQLKMEELVSSIVFLFIGTNLNTIEFILSLIIPLI